MKALKSSGTFQLNVLLPLSSFVTKSTKYQNIIERNLFVHQKSSPLPFEPYLKGLNFEALKRKFLLN